MLKLKLQNFGYLMQRAKSLEKTLMLGKIEGRRRKGSIEDEIFGWPHWLNVHEFEQMLGDSEGQGSLACFSSWGQKELDMSEWLNKNSKEGLPSIRLKFPNRKSDPLNYYSILQKAAWRWSIGCTWTSPDGQHQNQIDYMLCSQRWRSSVQSEKQDWELSVDQIMSSLLPNSDLNWRKWGKPLDHSGMT